MDVSLTIFRFCICEFWWELFTPVCSTRLKNISPFAGRYELSGACISSFEFFLYVFLVFISTVLMIGVVCLFTPVSSSYFSNFSFFLTASGFLLFSVMSLNFILSLLMKGMFRLSSSVSSPFFFLFLILPFELLFVSLSLQFSWDDKYVGGQFSIHPASRPSKSVLEGTGEALASYFLNNRGDDSTFIRRLISMCTKINEVGKAFGYHLLYLCLLCLL